MQWLCCEFFYLGHVAWYMRQGCVVLCGAYFCWQEWVRCMPIAFSSILLSAVALTGCRCCSYASVTTIQDSHCDVSSITAMLLRIWGWNRIEWHYFDIALVEDMVHLVIGTCNERFNVFFGTISRNLLIFPTYCIFYRNVDWLKVKAVSVSATIWGL